MSVSEWSGASLPWFEELADLKDRIGGLFRRAEPRRQVGLLLEGLIGGAERKNGWQLAEYAGDPAPWRMQALLGRTIWDQEKARDGVVTSLKEEHENSASRIFSNDSDCLAPHVHSRRAKGSVRPCRSEMTLDVESVVGGCVS